MKTFRCPCGFQIPAKDVTVFPFHCGACERVIEQEEAKTIPVYNVSMQELRNSNRAILASRTIVPRVFAEPYSGPADELPEDVLGWFEDREQS